MINPVEVELLLNNYPRVIVTDYLDGFGSYLLAEWKGDLFNVPQKVLVSKIAYRYVKWRIAWDEQLTRYASHKVRKLDRTNS
ncbi:hypothetical protein LCGC14_1050390 [marine sediment metagenome]|uniref:Uncharacterized protein n=1 Tax=marine sediment metagenome TaxID=412755 RepID=A0A0F9G2J0_9ZZZZ